jgi:CubicO group peptidase (beta-lactamase class C family)
MNTGIHGFCDRRFEPLKQAFADNFEAGREVGASFALTWRGEMMVDLWAGQADRKRGAPWTADTLVQVCSTTKIPLIVSALMLVDRGQLALDKTVAHYWPEFAQGGKAHVTVRDAFCHCGGVPGLDPPAPEGLAFDWDAMAARIAAEPHWFGGQRKILYHSSTYGWLLGELIRRVDGRRPAQFFREEIGQPAVIDFHIGLSSKADVKRVAVVPPIVFSAEHRRTFGADAQRMLVSIPEGDVRNLPLPMTWRHLSAEMPADIGFANGRSIARLGAILAGGGELESRRYLSRAIVEEAARQQVYDTCELFGPLRMGLGFGLWTEHFPAIAPTTFHWGGLGGSWAAMDMAADFSAGYAPNNFLVTPSGRSERQSGFFDALKALYPDLREGVAT